MDIDFWLALGLLAQTSFGMRFLIQCVGTEKNRKVTIPLAFWYLSLGGGLGLLAYAIHRRDPVFIIGQIGGISIYARNLMIYYRYEAGRHKDTRQGSEPRKGRSGTHMGGQQHADY